MLTPDSGSPTKLADWFNSLPWRADFVLEFVSEAGLASFKQEDFSWEKVKWLWTDEFWSAHPSRQALDDQYIFLRGLLAAFESSLSWGERKINPPPPVRQALPSPDVATVLEEYERLRANPAFSDESDQKLRRMAAGFVEISMIQPEPPPVAFAVPVQMFREMAWFWAEHGRVCIETGRHREAAMVFPPDFEYALDVWDSGKTESDWPEQHLDWGIVNALCVFNYLHAHFSALRTSGAQVAPEILRQLDEIRATQDRQLSMGRAHLELSLGTRERVEHGTRRLGAVEDLLLDTVIRITETLDVLSDATYAAERDILLAYWTKTQTSRERAETDLLLRELLGAAAVEGLAPETLDDLRAFQILSEPPRLQFARVATMAACCAVEREVRRALVRHGEFESELSGMTMEPLVRRAYLREGTQLSFLAELARRPIALETFRNKAAHPTRTPFSLEDLGFLRVKLFDPMKELGDHSLFSAFVTCQPKGEA